MIAKGRITKQGILDLNYYGPRRAKGAAAAPLAATVADAETGPDEKLPGPSPIGTQDDGAIVK